MEQGANIPPGAEASPVLWCLLGSVVAVGAQ